MKLVNLKHLEVWDIGQIKYYGSVRDNIMSVVTFTKWDETWSVLGLSRGRLVQSISVIVSASGPALWQN